MELEMNVSRMLITSLTVSSCFVVIAGASAQGLTRAQVREQLIEAQANGSRYVTDTSYPDVSPSFAQQVKNTKAPQSDGMGSPMPGTSESGGPRTACVGPVSFCNLYAGS
jgi:hypothetical protein